MNTEAETGVRVFAPRGRFEVGGRRVDSSAHNFDAAVTDAWTAHRPVRCLCRPRGVRMYLARHDDALIVKRMPNGGEDHASDCTSYETPAEVSGLQQVLGSAIVENAATGQTALRLAFPMSKVARPSGAPPSAGNGGSVASKGVRLSLRGLLHYLWDQAGLTSWEPGFAGRRPWATVRQQLLHGASNKVVRGNPLLPRLFIPEPFSVEHRHELDRRRMDQWLVATATPGGSERLMLLVAEVKEIVPARHGFKAIVKHLPDQAFALDDNLYRRLGTRFGPMLELWGAADDVRMIMIATFKVTIAGIPTVAELCLMPVTKQWIPIEDGFDRHLVERLVHDARTFVKGLRYDLSPATPLATATLTDCVGPATLLLIGHREDIANTPNDRNDVWITPLWRWNPADQGMPPLPARRSAQA